MEGIHLCFCSSEILKEIQELNLIQEIVITKHTALLKFSSEAQSLTNFPFSKNLLSTLKSQYHRYTKVSSNVRKQIYKGY